MIESIACTTCGTPLSGGIDTYGDHNEPFCFDCWGDVTRQETEDMYGPGPHIHDLTRTGSFVGSTVLLKLPEQGKSRWIDLAPLGGWHAEWMYKEDEECPGCGIYVHKSNFSQTRKDALNV